MGALPAMCQDNSVLGAYAERVYTSDDGAEWNGVTGPDTGASQVKVTCA